MSDESDLDRQQSSRWSAAGITAAVKHGIARVRSGGIAGETMWGLAFEAIALVSTLLAFTMLGRSLGTGGYGDYASLYAIIGPLGVLAASGVTLSLMEHVLRRREDLEDTVRSCLTVTLVIGTALTAVGVLIASWVVPTLALTTIGAVILLEFVSQPIGQIAATTVQVRSGYTPSMQLRIIPLALRVMIILVLHAMGQLTITTLGVTHLACSLVLSALLMRAVARHYGIRGTPGRPQPKHLKTSAVYSFGISGLSLQNDGDKAVLASYGFRETTGLYSAAYRIVQFGLLPVGTLVGVSHQRFLHHEEGNKRQHLHRSIRFAGVTAAYGIVFAIGVLLIAPILPKLMGEEFSGSVTMVRWLTPLVVLRGLAIFPLNGLMGLGKTFLRTVLLLASAAISMIMYIALVPSMSWKGAVLGTIIGEALLAIAAWILLLIYQQRDDDRIEAAEAATMETAPATV
ncbi:MAG: oligosaccharide flippase family protein [Ilumatobacteraceae bacterium]